MYRRNRSNGFDQLAPDPSQAEDDVQISPDFQIEPSFDFRQNDQDRGRKTTVTSASVALQFAMRQPTIQAGPATQSCARTYIGTAKIVSARKEHMTKESHSFGLCESADERVANGRVIN